MTSRHLVTTDRGKESGRSQWSAARAVVRAPDLLDGVPVPVLASSGMGAVGGCLDVLAGPARAGHRDATAALHILWDVLPRLVREPAARDLREQALAGAALAGAALEAAGPGPAQLLAEDLGATHRGDHGALLACLAPHVGAGGNLTGAVPAAESIREFGRSLGLPVELGAVCPSVDADAVVTRLAARPDLAGHADADRLLVLLKEAMQ